MGQRVTLEAIKHYGGADKVPITRSLVTDHNRARQQYHERIENERKEKQRSDAEIREENELKRKKEAAEAEKQDYESKKKRYDQEETIGLRPSSEMISSFPKSSLLGLRKVPLTPLSKLITAPLFPELSCSEKT